MVRKFGLPVLAPRPPLPTVDLMRKRLGGRASTEPGAGDAVTFTTPGGVRHMGVVLFVRGDELDVWVDENVVRRTRRAAASPLDATLPRDLVALAADARVFATLTEGQRICYLDEGRVDEGTLIEKCRFGALVERSDGTIVGLGFRRLWPKDDAPASEPS
ncbi:hypothetical protein [Polyangium sp. y55x31]|uniref:hypothetical protein n=1 Tax=Polyangium sp. y55x31 TaxID=3042688 RepID=UPI002482D928|nr:hypothetical protein [Polyangium sp. y55x31]MDI1477945.1 hypothetical protein [Polyangium sp. y55x31]